MWRIAPLSSAWLLSLAILCQPSTTHNALVKMDEEDKESIRLGITISKQDAEH